MNGRKNNLTCIGKVMKWFASRYPFLQKIDKFYVDLRDGSILVDVDGRKKLAVEFNGWDIERWKGKDSAKVLNETLQQIRIK